MSVRPPFTPSCLTWHRRPRNALHLARTATVMGLAVTFGADAVMDEFACGSTCSGRIGIKEQERNRSGHCSRDYLNCGQLTSTYVHCAGDSLFPLVRELCKPRWRTRSHLPSGKGVASPRESVMSARRGYKPRL
jgi:hypothetical protein